MAAYNSTTANGTGWYAPNRFCKLRWWHPTTALKADMPWIVRWPGGGWIHTPWVTNDQHAPTSEEVTNMGPAFDNLRANGFMCFNVERPHGAHPAHEKQLGETRVWPYLHRLQGRCIQYIQRHALDGTFTGGDKTKTLSLDITRRGIVGNSSGALMAATCAYEPDGSLPYDPLNVYSHDQFAPAHTHKIGFVILDASMIDWWRFDSLNADWDTFYRQGTAYFGLRARYSDIDNLPEDVRRAAGFWHLLKRNDKENQGLGVMGHFYGTNGTPLATAAGTGGVTKAAMITAWGLDTQITVANTGFSLWDPHDPGHGTVLEDELVRQDAENKVTVSRHKIYWGNATSNPSGNQGFAGGAFNASFATAVQNYLVTQLGITP